MNYTLAFVMAFIGTIIVAFWCIIYFKYKEMYDDVISAIDKKQFILPEAFFIGFGVIDLFKINLRSVSGRRKEKNLAEIYGEKYAEYYRYVIVGGQITYGITIAPLGFFIGAITNDLTFAILTIIAAAALIIYLDLDVKSAIDKRRDKILSDYPEALSQLTLLVNAGMVVRDAWCKVSENSDRPLYKEMKETSVEIQNGVSEIDAFYNFSQRCAVKEIRKFVSILTQNIQKGGAELTTSLKLMTTESWEEKKHEAKRKGELASQKLLIPVMIMFIGILIMIIVPVFSNMF